MSFYELQWALIGAGVVLVWFLIGFMVWGC